MRGAGAPTEGVNLLERGGSEEHAQRKGTARQPQPPGCGGQFQGGGCTPLRQLARSDLALSVAC